MTKQAQPSTLLLTIDLSPIQPMYKLAQRKL